MTAVGESENYNSDIMRVQEVRQNNSSTEKAYNYTFLCGNLEQKSSNMDRIFHTKRNHISSLNSRVY